MDSDSCQCWDTYFASLQLTTMELQDPWNIIDSVLVEYSSCTEHHCIWSFFVDKARKLWVAFAVALSYVARYIAQ